MVVRRDFAQTNPQAVSAFLRALVKGFKDVAANPDEGVAAVKRRDGLINEALERERLLLASRAFGLGSVCRERVERNVWAVAKSGDELARPKQDIHFVDRREGWGVP